MKGDRFLGTDCLFKALFRYKARLGILYVFTAAEHICYCFTKEGVFSLYVTSVQTTRERSPEPQYSGNRTAGRPSLVQLGPRERPKKKSRRAAQEMHPGAKQQAAAEHPPQAQDR
jgi:hypothetical protein